ncbi:sodium:solute symporter family protein [Pusillimonas sp. MFBS29]|uniref:sodium:solute symporter family protein n=1 Tax=Pusillimonas sp. MFBS29 TaxID=2886690 RepID=UPI001D118791|nr:sodium:solute symporter family protein [Pusillimonas sp. MFBS29]MCC2596674.1 sodium:solute symporter family protein [Pusillimonas sp. MFBS29]
MLTSTSAVLWLLLFSAGFAVSGMLYSRHDRGSLEDYVVARNTQGTTATILTLLATSLGAWILFAPAQAATWGGLAAVIGYGLGAASPRWLMIPLGQRMRELMPQGHTLTEFVIMRYGKAMYGLVLLIMMFYMFITLAAEITAIAKLVRLLAPVPLWVTAAIVMGSTLLYTSYGGLRASIFTDKVQMVVIVPLLLTLIALGWYATGGPAPVLEGLHEKAPQLLSLTDPTGLKAGLTFFVAILLTGLFHQGNWQRVYSARDTRTMRRGFLLGGLFAGPFILLMGLFGLAFVGLGHTGDSSVALFSVLQSHIPAWFTVALIPLGLALVMSTADTTISAISSLIAVDVRRLAPLMKKETLMGLSRWLIFLLAIPVMIVAAQGYSVLYLFLLADLFCSAAAFPVFFGLYNRRHNGTIAFASTLCGLIAGIMFFPAPGEKPTYLLESFLLAALVPALVSCLMLRLRARWSHFDLGNLHATVRNLDD